MPNLTLKALPGEVVKLYLAGQAEPYRLQRQAPAGAPVAQATADASGLVTFIGQPTRIEFLAMRPDFS
jgi:hypothetical protein